METPPAMRDHLPCRICATPVALVPRFRRVKTAICPSCAHEGLDKIVNIRLFKERLPESLWSDKILLNRLFASVLNSFFMLKAVLIFIFSGLYEGFLRITLTCDIRGGLSRAKALLVLV